MIKTDAKKIAIYLTNKCNLRCKHCFIEGAPQNDQFLNWEQIQAVLNHFIKDGYSAVEFTGGESCLSPYLVSSVKLAKKLGYTVGVNTNGINAKLLTSLSPKLVDKVTFSLDGATAKTHDFLRGEGAFNRTLETIKSAISAKFYTEAIFTVHRFNETEVAQAIQLLDEIGVGRLSFNFISNQGSATIHRDLLLSPERWIKARQSIEANSDTKQLSLRFPLLFVTSKEFTQLKKKHRSFLPSS